MKPKKTYDIFISYRREGGESTAKMLYDSLSDMGYQVFLDVETLRSGQFNTELYEVMDNCQDVILVLAPGSLDRCVHEDDWVRLEIAHALKQGKNIVPVMLRGFSFPEQLPEDIDPVRFCNGLTVNTEFYNAFLSRLREFLKSRPVIIQLIKFNATWKKTAAIILALVVLCFAGIGGRQLWKTRFPDEYPKTQAEKNAVGRLMGNLSVNFAAAEVLFQQNSQAYDAYEKYLRGDETYENLTNYIDFYSSEITRIQDQFVSAPPDLLMDLKDSSISLADFEALKQMLDTCAADSLHTFQVLNTYLGPDSPLSATDKAIVLSTNKETTIWEADAFLNGVYELLLPISQDATASFRKDVLPTLYYINKLKTVSWTSDPDQIAATDEELKTRAKRMSDKLTETVGNSNMQLAIEKTGLSDIERLYQYMTDQGISAEEAQRQLNTWLSAGLSIPEILRLYETGEWEIDPEENEQYRSDLKKLLSDAGYTKQKAAEMMEIIDESGVPAKAFYNSLHEQLERLASKTDVLNDQTKQLNSKKQKLDDLHATIRKDNTPDKQDSLQTALNKVCRFIDVWLYDDAIVNCDFMLENGGSDTAVYQAMKSYIGQIRQTGIDYGLLVVSNDKGMMDLLPGDIILAIDGKICWSNDTASGLMEKNPDSHTFSLEILRMTDGAMKPVTINHTGKKWGITLFPIYPSYRLAVPEDPEQKNVYEDTIPYDGDSKDILIDKAITRLQANMSHESRQIFQECMSLYGKQDPQLKAGLISAINFIPSNPAISCANGAVVIGCEEDLPVKAGDIIIKAGDAWCSDLSALYKQLKNDGTPCSLLVLRRNDKGDFEEIEITGDNRIKQCRLMEFNRLAN